MKVPAYIRRAIHAWAAWRARQRLYAAIPELRELDRQQAATARLHRSGARVIAEQKRRAMTARLRLEVRHG